MIRHLAIFLLFPFAIQAQITLTADQINPIGYMAVQAHDSIPDPSIQPGGSGLQSWDFSALKEQSTDTLRFFEPDETLYGDTFPEANIAVKLDTSIYIYLEKNDDRLNLLGSYGTLSYGPFTLTTGIFYMPPQSVLRFPANLNDSYSENFQTTVEAPGSEVGTTFEKVRLRSRIQRHVVIDAYGTVTTPSGDFETLRSTETEISTDSVYVYSGGLWFPLQGTGPDTTIFYNWWTSQGGLGFPVVQIEYTASNGESTVSWLKDAVSSSREKKQSLRISLYPNPASHLLTLDIADAGAAGLEIFNMNGQMVLSQKVQNRIETVEVQTLNAGPYVVVLKSEAGRVLGSGRFEISR